MFFFYQKDAKKEAKKESSSEESSSEESESESEDEKKEVKKEEKKETKKEVGNGNFEMCLIFFFQNMNKKMMTIIIATYIYAMLESIVENNIKHTCPSRLVQRLPKYIATLHT